MDSADSNRPKRFDVAVVGGGSAGISICAMLRAREPSLRVALVDASETHSYQPAWSLVGANSFDAPDSRRAMASVIPAGVEWIRRSVRSFDPAANTLYLGAEPASIIPSDTAASGDSDSSLRYDRLVVCPGLELDWPAIEGLAETLGANGVTSNYDYASSQYTAELVRSMPPGSRAVFTQPPGPIKCAGAPQKAMYLSCFDWESRGLLPSMSVAFYTATPTLFGVEAFVPALDSYIHRYGVSTHFEHTLTKVDGPNRIATFARADGTNADTRFDMLHVVPPMHTVQCVRESPLAGAAGYVEVNIETLHHTRFRNVWALGDAIDAPNAKTGAAVRKQAPVVVHNLLQDVHASTHGNARRTVAIYDGYGACPVLVEKGRAILAEFGWGGKLLPSFPPWLLDGTKPTRLAWLFVTLALPPFYWHVLLPGRAALDPLSRPEVITAEEYKKRKPAEAAAGGCA
jgi:sulfide:quinone oxidoreductase